MKRKIIELRGLCQKHDYLFLIIGTILYELIIYYFSTVDIIKEITMSIFVLGIIILLFNKKNIYKMIFYILYIVGIIVRTKYIMKIDIYSNQHDVGNLKDDIHGHLQYIYILYKTYKLPVINEWQFYHPPLWHMIAAVWVKLNTLMKVDFEYALEGIQILTLLFSSFMVIVIDKICYKLKIKPVFSLITDLIFVFHPALIMFSASINNDCLVTFLEFLIILLLINWHELPSWKNTIILAVVTGLCVMTKSNGALMAVPILYVFINKLIYYIKKEKIEIKTWFYKMLTFCFISLPIGLWFQIRSLIVFKKLPVVPIPSLIKITDSIINKFFSLNIGQLISYKNIIDDTNIPAHIIKTATIGEWPYEKNDIILTILLILSLLVVITSIAFAIDYLVRNRKNVIINTLIITWIINIISIYIFYYKYPYICSMDFRYIAICSIPNTIIITYLLKDIKKNYIKIPIIVLYSIYIMLNIILIFKYF